MNTTAPVPAPRRRVWPWALLMLVPALLVAAALASWLGDAGSLPLHVVVDGDEVWDFDPGAWGAAHPIGVLLGVAVAFVVVAVVVPLALGIALVATAFGLLVGLGVPLLVALLVTALVLSPFLLLVALGAWLWRKASPPAGGPAANIAP